jgi:hypothetical protein
MRLGLFLLFTAVLLLLGPRIVPFFATGHRKRWRRWHSIVVVDHCGEPRLHGIPQHGINVSAIRIPDASVL